MDLLERDKKKSNKSGREEKKRGRDKRKGRIKEVLQRLYKCCTNWL